MWQATFEQVLVAVSSAGSGPPGMKAAAGKRNSETKLMPWGVWQSVQVSPASVRWSEWPDAATTLVAPAGTTRSFAAASSSAMGASSPPQPGRSTVALATRRPAARMRPIR